ncbi:MAG: GNAT family N-acetyltransferase [Acidobacteria bacterium]|nr:MAG: GNAT family N-acetyltransferase [Acidobacteriota bacterium]
MAAEYRFRSAEEQDAERIAAFNERIFRPSVGVWARDLLSSKSPRLAPGDFSLVEDASSGEIVSSLCCIEQHWELEGVTIPVGQIELVGTDERHRGHGLLREQMRWFDKRLLEKGCVLACVQGIPAFYQRMGYHAAVPLKGGMRLAVEQIPSKPRGSSVRRCTRADLVELADLYEKSTRWLAVRSLRNARLWEYQEGQNSKSEHAYDTYVIERSGHATGYARFGRQTRSNAVVLRELAVSSEDDVIAALGCGRKLASERGCNAVIMQLPSGHGAFDLVRHWSPEVIPPFAWMVRIPDWYAFFTLLKPVLDRRVGRSLLAGFSGEVRILLDDRQVTQCLTFRRGRLTDAGNCGKPDKWCLRVTEPILVKLTLGYRSREALEDWFVEMQSQAAHRYLIDTLFPQLRAFVYETY